MRIVFMGTPSFAVPSLKALFEAGHEIAAVVTAPDKPKGRGLEMSKSEVKMFAEKADLRVLQPANLKSDDFLSELRRAEPELIVVVAFRILPAEVFTLPRFGSINLHASLLPKYRGAAPINRAIMNGEAETGVTTFFLKEKVDTGNIILQESTAIGEDENAGDLHDRLAMTGAQALVRTLSLIESGNELHLVKQDDSQASPAPKIFRNDCAIDWTGPAAKLHCQIRGLSPYPGAFSRLDGKIFKIFGGHISEIAAVDRPGTLSVIDKKLYVNAADVLYELLTVQPEGKRRMSSSEFLAGHPHAAGLELVT